MSSDKTIEKWQAKCQNNMFKGLFPLRLCVALRGDRNRYTIGVSIFLATQRNATSRIYDTLRMAPLNCCWWHIPLKHPTTSRWSGHVYIVICLWFDCDTMAHCDSIIQTFFTNRLYSWLIRVCKVQNKAHHSQSQSLNLSFSPHLNHCNQSVFWFSSSFSSSPLSLFGSGAARLLFRVGHNCLHFPFSPLPFFSYLHITNPLFHKVLTAKSEGTVSL